MKRIYTFLLAMSVLPFLTLAQDIDLSYVFVDENGTEIENGATVVRNQVEDYGEGAEVIYSGLSVKKSATVTSNYLRVRYKVVSIDNGTYQLCFPMNCAMHTEAGEYITKEGQLMSNPQNIQSEWFPAADGSCIVELTIEVMKQVTPFPPQYELLAYGPSLTLRFEKGSSLPGDVNGDGAVNIGDINYIIDHILNPKEGDMSADANGDGNVNISDINAVIGMILK